MHRTNLLQLLQNYSQSVFLSDDEKPYLEKMPIFIKNEPACFERTPKSHVTASALVVSHDLQKCLLQHGRKVNLWIQFGGHPDGDNDVERVAMRETQEESGIVDLSFLLPGIVDIDIHALPGTLPCEWHYDVRFFIKAKKDAEYVINHESFDLKWATPEEARKLVTDTGTLRLINKWARMSDVCVVKKSDGIIPLNSYFKDKLKGCHDVMLTRRAVLERLEHVAKNLAPDYGLMIFDAFRTIETQTDLFNLIYSAIKKQHPYLSGDDLDKKTRRFVAHPNDPSRFAIPPHNSGGAIDLTLFDKRTGQPCNMGTGFDEVCPATRTSFFEDSHDTQYGFSESAWQIIRHNRRILLNAMLQAGFINYHEEWWHYDFGDCIWGNELGIDWIFGSMEPTAASFLIGRSAD